MYDSLCCVPWLPALLGLLVPTHPAGTRVPTKRLADQITDLALGIQQT